MLKYKYIKSSKYERVKWANNSLTQVCLIYNKLTPLFNVTSVVELLPCF
jgi:hypothetical protein